MEQGFFNNVRVFTINRWHMLGLATAARHRCPFPTLIFFPLSLSHGAYTMVWRLHRDLWQSLAELHSLGRHIFLCRTWAVLLGPQSLNKLLLPFFSPSDPHLVLQQHSPFIPEMLLPGQAPGADSPFPLLLGQLHWVIRQS